MVIDRNSIQFRRTFNTNMENHVSNNTSVMGNSGKLLNEQLVIIYNRVVFGVLCQSLAIFGIGTNLINIICFAQQGFKDQINISLTGTSVSLWFILCVDTQCLH